LLWGWLRTQPQHCFGAGYALNAQQCFGAGYALLYFIDQHLVVLWGTAAAWSPPWPTSKELTLVATPNSVFVQGKMSPLTIKPVLLLLLDGLHIPESLGRIYVWQKLPAH
jgi:hypothetical protein